MSEASDLYGSLLNQLAEAHPRIVSPLQRAQQHRERELGHLVTGARLAGLEELLRHLDDVSAAWGRSLSLTRLRHLVDRAITDFESALEATLSGQRGLVADLMRDVSEIELLLLDFTLDLDRIDQWLSADRRERLRQFAPARIRERLKEEGGERYDPHRADYAAHSEALHVTPLSHPFASRGIASDQDSLLADLGFWEMFEHARRLLVAIDALHDRVGEDFGDHVRRLESLMAVELAWERTQEMQALFLALVEASQALETDEDVDA